MQGNGERKRRTTHGWQRHRERIRPTEMAFSDKEKPEEIYEQIDGRTIYVGKRRRVHVFEGDSHLTSFRMSRQARLQKVRQGKWKRIY